MSPIRYLARVFAVCLLAASACATAPQEEHPISRMAQFDLNCPRAKLSFTILDENTVGATGCGRRIRYVRVCRQGDLDEDCRWMAN